MNKYTKIVLWFIVTLHTAVFVLGCTRYEAIDISLVHIEAQAFSSGHDIKELPKGVNDDED